VKVEAGRSHAMFPGLLKVMSGLVPYLGSCELQPGLIRVGNREDATSNARCRTVTLLARLQITYEFDDLGNRAARGKWAAVWESCA